MSVAETVHRTRDPDRTGAGETDDAQRDQRPVGQPRAQRPTVQLVERVRRDADREEERTERRAEPIQVKRRRGGRTERHVGEMPRRVWRMQQRQQVAHGAAAAKRVERRAVELAAHGRLAAVITTPAPKLIRRTRTSVRPARSHSATSAGSGTRA